jgi:hypothetical protein
MRKAHIAWGREQDAKKKRTDLQLMRSGVKILSKHQLPEKKKEN